MKKYFKLLKTNMLLELSKYRQRAHLKIDGLMVSLLEHLIIINELGKKHRDYKKHIKEIAEYKRLIKKYNIKRNTNKNWFDNSFIIELSEDSIDIAVMNVKMRYPKIKFKYDYTSLENFSWFSLY